MTLIGTQRYIYFYVLNSGTPVTGLVKSSFTIIFTRNNAACLDTLSITEIGSGRYYASYTPSTKGTDYLEIDLTSYSLKLIDVETIYAQSDFTGGSDTVDINQNYPTANALTVTQVTSPQTYTLYVFFYSDWQIGNQSTSYAQGQTSINSDGTWVDIITVLPGAYNIVVTNGSSTIVIASNLSVT